MPAIRCRTKILPRLSLDELDHTFRTNVFATFLLSQAALKKLPAGGVILNTTSIQAYDPSPQLVVYAATKAAILSMTKSIADLAIKQGVRVNAVAPGPVWTPLIPSTMPPAKKSRRLAPIPASGVLRSRSNWRRSSSFSLLTMPAT